MVGLQQVQCGVQADSLYMTLLLVLYTYYLEFCSFYHHESWRTMFPMSLKEQVRKSLIPGETGQGRREDDLLELQSKMREHNLSIR
jgi:hypothetical protein